ncbi:MAG: hypothetical protein LBQ66_15645 [Planctomycetaceae bacterium]|jgi:hypothetical protein|nr:hypothetical protein [Planctomycetaceae bacterium]
MKRILLICIVVCLLFGCDRASISGLVPVSGKVLLDDKPIGGVSIVFTPQANSTSDRVASAVTQNDGTFVLNTLGYKGGLPGNYNVILSKETLISKVSPEEEAKMQEQGKEIPEPEHVYHIPQSYQNAATSGITITISEKGNKGVIIKLKSK